MGYTNRTICRSCSETLPPPLLSLGIQPLANNLTERPDQGVALYPLNVIRCANCGLTQLSAVVDPVELFGEYLYTPSQSKTFRTHFDIMAQTLSRILAPDDLVVDIGSNDGLLLSR